MLSCKDKAEFVKDGLSVKRRKRFAKVNTSCIGRSLDSYIRFLKNIQKVMPFTASKHKPHSALNKL